MSKSAQSAKSVTPSIDDKEKQERLTRIVYNYNNGTPEERQQAMEDFWRECEGFIGHVIHKYFAPFADEYYYDLYEEGVVIALSEMGNYDPSRTRLTTFLTNHIVGAMSKFVNSMVSNKSSAHYSTIMNKVRKAVKHFDKENIEPTKSNIALYTGLKIDQVEMGLEMINRADEKHYETQEDLEAMTTSCAPDPEKSALATEESDTLGKALDSLTKTDKKIILMRFGLQPYDHEMRCTEIAKALDMPCKEVRVRLAKGLRDLQSDTGLRALHYGEGKPKAKKEDIYGSEVDLGPSESIIDLYENMERYVCDDDSASLLNDYDEDTADAEEETDTIIGEIKF